MIKFERYSYSNALSFSKTLLLGIISYHVQKANFNSDLFIILTIMIIRADFKWLLNWVQFRPDNHSNATDSDEFIYKPQWTKPSHEIISVLIYK